MKIVSKFKDYYDSVSRQYLDKEIVYLRESKSIEIDRNESPNLAVFHILDQRFQKGILVTKNWVISLEVIGFCGNLFPVIWVSDSNATLSRSEYKQSAVGFYSISELRAYIIEHQIPTTTSKYRRYWFSHYSYENKMEDFERFFNSRERFTYLDRFFRQLNTPCFVVKHTKDRDRTPTLITNPFLKNYSFAKVKNPFSAHQELYQFVGGYLSQPERKMITLSDKDKAHKHGFDKWSFRKMPSGK